MKTKSTLAAAAVETVDVGTANVFADLGLPDPDKQQLRVKLATVTTQTANQRRPINGDRSILG
jgi:hypothetical protein